MIKLECATSIQFKEVQLFDKILTTYFTIQIVYAVQDFSNGRKHFKLNT